MCDVCDEDAIGRYDLGRGSREPGSGESGDGAGDDGADAAAAGEPATAAARAARQQPRGDNEELEKVRSRCAKAVVSPWVAFHSVGVLTSGRVRLRLEKSAEDRACVVAFGRCGGRVSAVRACMGARSFLLQSCARLLLVA